jgi:hypothetical protein
MRRESLPSQNEEKPTFRVYGKRFCATCGYSKNLDTGRVVDYRTDRWVCFPCLENPPPKDVSEQETD